MSRLQFYTTQTLGPKRRLTPEGFLVCEEVPLARTGEMVYGPGELPDDIPLGPDGVVRVQRDPDEVFRPEFVLSFTGKPFVDDHPPTDINPGNWSKYARGTVLNPRRGAAPDDDLLLGDIIVTDTKLIDLITRNMKTEVSCGYDAEYEVDDNRPGFARQYSMVGNHVALVDSGRCGPRCAIGDRKTVKGDILMTAKVRDKKHTWLDKLLEAFKAKDEGKMEEAIEEGKKQLDEFPPKDPEEKKEAKDDAAPGEEHIHIHAGGGGSNDEGRLGEFEGRLGTLESGHEEIKDSLDSIKKHLGIDAGSEGGKPEEELEAELAEEAPAGTGDKARKARDSAYLGESFQSVLAGAEILAPGIRVPTFDAASAPKKTYDAICKLRRQALDLSYATPSGRGEIEEVYGKEPDFECMTCDAIRALFKGAVALRKVTNNASRDNTQTEKPGAGGGLGIRGPITSNAALNQANREFYKKKAVA